MNVYYYLQNQNNFLKLNVFSQIKHIFVILLRAYFLK